MYVKPNRSFQNFIKKNISKNAVQKNKVDKKNITNIIFNDDVAKSKLEKYIHKEVQISREKFIQKNISSKRKIVFADIPLLFENNLQKKFNLIICIISSKKNRSNRILKNKKFSKKILKKIFSAQTSDKERRRHSHIIINNNKTKKDFIFNAEKALTEILK